MKEIKKWTDYYGGLRLVTLDVNKEGKWTGGYCYNGVGILGEGKPRRLPSAKDGFWKTAEEAKRGHLEVLRREELEAEEVLSFLVGAYGPSVVLKWCEHQAKEQKEYLRTLRKNIAKLEKVNASKMEDDDTLVYW